MELRFEGHSDDTFGEYAHFHDDYDCCASGAMIAFKLEHEDPDHEEGRGLYVCGQYSGKQWPKGLPGCWIIGIQPLEEDIPLPKWPMRWETSDSGYNPVLVISIPIGVKMSCVNSSR